jgi:hypothetical protein
MMQDMEAEIMVFEVYPKLLEERHIVLVLYDAILCNTEEAAKRAEKLIKQGF